MKKILRSISLWLFIALSAILCVAWIRSELAPNYFRRYYEVRKWGFDLDARNGVLTVTYLRQRTDRRDALWEWYGIYPKRFLDAEIHFGDPDVCWRSLPNAFGWKTIHMRVRLTESEVVGPFHDVSVVYVPFWILILIFAPWPLVVLVRYIHKRMRKPGFCPICGYDLRATPERCPECGTVVSKSAQSA